MKQVELYFLVRHAVRIEGLSERAAARRFGIDPRTVSKMLKFSIPPGYRRLKPPIRPKRTRLLRSSTAFSKRTKAGPRSSSIRRSGSSSGCGTSMASPGASRS